MTLACKALLIAIAAPVIVVGGFLLHVPPAYDSFVLGFVVFYIALQRSPKGGAA